MLPLQQSSLIESQRLADTLRLCRLNLAVHGLEGDISHGGQVNSYDDDPHDATGRFDFVLATATCASAKSKLTKPDRRSVGEAELHPPFNVNAVTGRSCFLTRRSSFRRSFVDITSAARFKTL